MLDLLKDCCNCFLLSSVKKHLNEHRMFCPPSCHMRHFQNFDKFESFLKPILNIFILGSLIVRWGKGVLKEEAGIMHQIYRFKGVLIVGRVGFIKLRVGII